MLKKHISLLMILYAFIGCSVSNNNINNDINKDKLDSLFISYSSNDKFMGSVTVSKEGKVIYQKSVGYEDIEKKKIATNMTLYKIGSISKTFTSALIFKAIEENKITLDTKLNKFFPEIVNSDVIDINLLLSHRSGIHNFTANDGYLSWAAQKKDRNELMKIIEDGGSDFKPDSLFSYSNSNYVILSFILEDIYNTSFENILDKKIIKPLKLKNTFYCDSNNIERKACCSYLFTNNWTKDQDTHPTVTKGAGGIVSTTEDLNIFYNSLFNFKVVCKESLAEMTNIKDGGGKGLFQIPFYETFGFGHSGGIDGFASISIYFPKDKITYSLTSNGVNCVINDITIAVLEAAYNKDFKIPSFKKQIISQDILNELTGTYSSNDFPLKIVVRNNNGALEAQATGQNSFMLDADNENVFKNMRYGIIMTFNRENNLLTLSQSGKLIKFVKE
ncbi:MAG: serine hydrolase domain-containing protein [Bacteroidales bacterium]|nr:serine hydrolase domain-containing protein [Bacteroidales bacterium]